MMKSITILYIELYIENQLDLISLIQSYQSKHRKRHDDNTYKVEIRFR